MSFQRSTLGALAIAIGLIAGQTAHAANEQYFPLQSYRVGPYAAGGSGFFGGFLTTYKTSMHTAASMVSSSHGLNVKPNTLLKKALNATNA